MNGFEFYDDWGVSQAKAEFADRALAAAKQAFLDWLHEEQIGNNTEFIDGYLAGAVWGKKQMEGSDDGQKK